MQEEKILDFTLKKVIVLFAMMQENKNINLYDPSR